MASETNAALWRKVLVTHSDTFQRSSARALPRSRADVPGRVRAIGRFARPAIIAIGTAALCAALLAWGDALFRASVREVVVELVATFWLGGVHPRQLVSLLMLPTLASSAVAVPVLGLPALARVGRRVAQQPDAKGTRRMALSSADVLATLGALAATLVGFATLQWRAFREGLDYLATTTGLTIGEYAGDGFLTLTGAALLAVLVLVLLDRHGAKRLNQSLSTCAASLAVLALTLGMLLSSAVRSTLYMQAFGASAGRIWAMGAVAWIVVAIGWLSFAIARSHTLVWPRAFALAALTAALVALGVATFASVAPIGAGVA